MLSIDSFKDVLRSYPSGVTIITSADAAGVPSGATVSAFSSLSLNPPLVLVCLTAMSRSVKAIRDCQAFSVHILGEEDAALAIRFASDGEDKFSGLPHDVDSRGVPVLSSCAARLDCGVFSEYPGGDHVIFVGAVTEAVLSPGRSAPLVYANRKFSRPVELLPAEAAGDRVSKAG